MEDIHIPPPLPVATAVWYSPVDETATEVNDNIFIDILSLTTSSYCTQEILFDINSITSSLIGVEEVILVEAGPLYKVDDELSIFSSIFSSFVL